MLTVRGLLRVQLDETFAREGWHPPLATAVHGLTAAQAAWKPAPERHSIWQIVRHVIHWKRGVLRALEGDPPDYERMTAEDWAEVSGDQAAWEADVRALQELYEAFGRLLEALGEDGVQRAVQAYRQSSGPTPVARRLLNAFTHDAYHTGQIQYLRALQGIPLDRLMTAAWDGLGDRLAQVLDQAPALVHAYNGDGWSALHIAAHAGQAEAVAMLLDRGADLDARSRNAQANTALHAAIAGWRSDRRTAVVDLLLGRSADPNARDARGNTPLHLAAHEGDAAVAGRLLSAGADVHVRRADGATPVEVADARGHTAVADLLRARAAAD
ncbi:MAG: DinB family protein [Armatimonadota bacterium]|nr:DinB family protein [Armatimonadota bacterium]MDR7449298.1 DinB family protein [Armatimonadota bacterium]MDR7459638.1 DinB family protein [Armatimonadota bacterium]MDR7480578.1 DinB family protein [Armatimonadota bacterium]MDR7489274.1 DinB family protein [Armatimonadota bacterium]